MSTGGSGFGGNKWSNIGAATVTNGSNGVAPSSNLTSLSGNEQEISNPIQMQLEALLQMMSQQKFSQNTDGQTGTSQATMAKTGTRSCEKLTWIVDSGATDHMTYAKKISF